MTSPQSISVWLEEQWNLVHFSDESKSNLFAFDGKRFVRRKNGERLFPQRVKKNCEIWRGSVMVWGMISSAEVGPIVRFHGNINASVYKELRQHALLHLRKGTVETPIFMKDNAPCHKAKTVLSFHEEEGIAIMKWPPQSPDMNPMENIWNIIGEKAQNINPQNIDDLWGFLKKKINGESITATFCQKLIGSCGQRCNEVIQCKGKFTKY